MDEALLGADEPHPPHRADGPPGGFGSAATPVLSVVAALIALVVLVFFGAAGVAVWHRSRHAAQTSTSSPLGVPPSDHRVATVNAKGQLAGRVRAAADSNSGVVDMIPDGASIEVFEDAVGPAANGTRATWYHVRGVVQGRRIDGWMHSDIVRF